MGLSDTTTSNPVVTLATIMAILLAVVAGFGVIIYDENERQANRITQASNVSLLFEQHTLRILRYADTYIRSARRVYLNTGSVEAVDALIEQAPLDRGTLSHITIIGAGGVPLMVSGKKIKPGTHARDREYFKFQQSTTGDQLFISLPIKGRNSEKITMRLVRRMENQAGEFRGIIFAAISVPRIVEYFDQLQLADDSTFMLVGLDQKIRAYTNYESLSSETSLSNSLLWESVAKEPVGLFPETSVIDGLERIYAYRKIPDYDLIVVTGIADTGHWFLALPVLSTTILAILLILAVSRMIRRQISAEQKYASSILKSSTDAILMADQRGLVISTNPAVKRVFRISSGDIIGKPLTDLIPGIEVGAAPGEDTVFLKGTQDENTGESTEASGFSHEGRKFPILLSMFETGLGREKYFTYIIHDLSARKVVEQKLIESEGKFKDFAGVASDWFWEMDKNLRFSYFSEKFREVAAVNPDDLLGKTREETRIPDVSPELWQEHLENLRDRKAFRGFVHPGTKPDGSTVWLSVSGLPVYDNEGQFKGFRGVGSDITSAVESERELVLAKEKAEKASNAKTEFLSSMSHELRTPMNAILGFAQILLMDNSESLSAEQSDFVKQISQAGDHLLRLITDILDLNKIDSGIIDLHYEVISLDEIVDYCVSLQCDQARKMKVDIHKMKMAGGYPKINLDKTRLTQIVLNIMSNAVKYNRVAGKVTIECEIRESGNVRLSISDTGRGIAESMRDRIFEPFDRLGRESGEIEGTGIGMTITRRLVDLLECVIDFESVPEVGTRFWIEFPANMVVNSEAQSIAESTDVKILESQTHEDDNSIPVLYIEDNLANQMLMKSVAKLVPEISLIIADDAETGIEMAERIVPGLILLDINLPGMSGLEAVRVLKTSDKASDIPIVVVSSGAMESQIKAALATGVKDYITKPVKIDEMVEAIRKYSLSPDYHNEETAYLMASPKNAERLNKAIAEVEAGKTVGKELIEE